VVKPDVLAGIVAGHRPRALLVTSPHHRRVCWAPPVAAVTGSTRRGTAHQRGPPSSAGRSLGARHIWALAVAVELGCVERGADLRDVTELARAGGRVRRDVWAVYGGCTDRIEAYTSHHYQPSPARPVCRGRVIPPGGELSSARTLSVRPSCACGIGAAEGRLGRESSAPGRQARVARLSRAATIAAPAVS
jgi:hypothetical protein